MSTDLGSEIGPILETRALLLAPGRRRSLREYEEFRELAEIMGEVDSC